MKPNAGKTENDTMKSSSEKPFILVVEDSPTQAETLRYLLERRYAVDVARNGREGLEKIREKAPDIVISDIIMPEIDGYELCRRVKEDDRLKATPVMLLTALSDRQDVINGLASGADGFITKPYSKQFLLSRVQDILSNRQSTKKAAGEGSDAIYYGGEWYPITANRAQIIDMLMSTFENAAHKSRELDKANDELTRAQQRMQDLNQQLRADIVQRKRMEVELKRHAASLTAVNKELEAFSYSVSHDLRAPLRAIAGFSEILSEDYADTLDETGREYFQRILHNTKKMSGLIDDMLSLSRITRQEVDLRDVDISALAHTIVEEIRQEASRRDAVDVYIQQGLRALGDTRLLHIALTNLIRNAWKYTGNTERPHIEIGADQTANEKVFFVKDNGVGFDMKYAERLFAPFQRLHTDREFPGSGIGLPIVERVVRKHGGKVWAESSVGHGAAFYFTLPGSGESESF